MYGKPATDRHRRSGNCIFCGKWIIVADADGDNVNQYHGAVYNSSYDNRHMFCKSGKCTLMAEKAMKAWRKCVNSPMEYYKDAEDGICAWCILNEC